MRDKSLISFVALVLVNLVCTHWTQYDAIPFHQVNAIKSKGSNSTTTPTHPKGIYRRNEEKGEHILILSNAD